MGEGVAPFLQPLFLSASSYPSRGSGGTELARLACCPGWEPSTEAPPGVHRGTRQPAGAPGSILAGRKATRILK